MTTGMHDAPVDWAGVAHPPAGAAPRIACLVPSITELLFALGLGNRVVALVRGHDGTRGLRGA